MLKNKWISDGESTGLVLADGSKVSVYHHSGGEWAWEHGRVVDGDWVVLFDDGEGYGSKKKAKEVAQAFADKRGAS